MNISVTFYLPFEVRGFACVQLLDLSGCGLDEWSQVSAFGCLPALKELRIDENLIQVLEWSGIELSVGDGFTKYPFALLIMNLSLQSACCPRRPPPMLRRAIITSPACSVCLRALYLSFLGATSTLSTATLPCERFDSITCRCLLGREPLRLGSVNRILPSKYRKSLLSRCDHWLLLEFHDLNFSTDRW